ncbi:MAG: hypothetical protein HC828_03600 [Blastochloris sp.]|nr:hypothetical protein [Blastochloris sp.]
MRKLIAANGMLVPTEWNKLDFSGKCGWLASLDDIHVRAQASVFAATGHHEVDSILRAWGTIGYLDAERMQRIMRADLNHARGGTR